MLKFIARAQHARGIWCQEGQLNRMAQRVSCTLIKYAAQAALKRSPPMDLKPRVPLEVPPDMEEDQMSEDED